MIRNCKVCGATYETCYSCEKERSWRIHTDTHEHYYIFMVLMEYLSSHDAKRAYHDLRKRGIDLHNTDAFTPDVGRILTEINASVQVKGKAKKAPVDEIETGFENAAEKQQEET